MGKDSRICFKSAKCAQDTHDRILPNKATRAMAGVPDPEYRPYLRKHQRENDVDFSGTSWRSGPVPSPGRSTGDLPTDLIDGDVGPAYGSPLAPLFNVLEKRPAEGAVHDRSVGHPHGFGHRRVVEDAAEAHLQTDLAESLQRRTGGATPESHLRVVHAIWYAK